ncbi:DUF4099 domain-containing protein [Mucilaginibacter gotjawali]|uniref:DUF4099 domain-containing protein n=2 Tax=Mucilaginibacter gotjawali TaxID=1550579 RepID=A0A110B3M0_9SPHI|nr:DUF4099 domain-containing protein [Mucilaginibacter gotjawali]MBB3058754.1 hypothetical protein [Mucilaginibacter gotjawali]BAU55643.1 hypothetical protein MgSA37_03834 [Mucilaginibacter gotjawali]
MIKQVFNWQDLPMEELEKIHLAKDGELLLEKDDLTQLLSGRRTSMLRLEDLELDGLRIEVLDAKLSLKENKDGSIGLLLHPIYRKPDIPSFLTAAQAEMLEKGDIISLQKMIFDDEGHAKEVLVEFDKDTNEFIITDTEKIQAPDMINGIPLTAEQKDRYKKGREVETPDGTTIQYSGTDKQGIRSDKLALIASIIVDGGVSYMLYKGLHALWGKEDKKRGVGKNYHEALKEMQQRESRDFAKPVQDDLDNEHSETISR